MSDEIEYETSTRGGARLISFSETGPEADEVSKLLEHGWVITRLISNEGFVNKDNRRARTSTRPKSKYTAMLEKLEPDFEENLTLSKRRKLEFILA